MKLTELLELYKELKPELSIYTVEKYQRVVNLFIKDIGKDSLSIDLNEITEWRVKIYNRSSAINCNTYHRHLKSLFNAAVKLKLINNNPFVHLKLLKISNTKKKTINKKELGILIDFIKIDSYYSKYKWFYLALIDTLRITAIRRRQLIGIKWRDIDFENMTLYLDPKFNKNQNENLQPLNATLFNHFKTLKSKFPNAKSNDQVFNITKIVLTYKSKEMTTDHVSALFSAWSKKINIKVSAHRFRHTFATNSVKAGANLKSLKEYMGHSNIQTTLGYVETDIDDLKKIQSLLM